jgi:hypothetical protein
MLGWLAGLAATQAQTTPPAAASPTEEWIKKIKKPADWLTWGADLRLRNEYYENALTLNPLAPFHDQNYGRFRARVFGSIIPVKKLSLNFRVTAEPRYWSIESVSGAWRNRRGTDWTEGVVDNLNLKWSEILGQPLTLIAGRQDIMLADGWLAMDGTPMDGSRTFFYDAIRLTLDLKEHKTTVDAMYIDQGAFNDHYMPVIRNLEKAITDQDERGMIFWVGNKTIKELNVDGYFMYKHDRSPLTAAGVRSDIYTLGGRLSGMVGENDHWKYRVEGAVQVGRKQELRLGPAFNSIRAFGLNSQIAYLFKDKLNNQVRMEYEYLSGDNPNSSRNEMFDVLWGRWPRFSELYIYSYANETRMAQLANLHRLGPGYSISPIKNMELTLNYNLLWADQPAPALAGANTAFSRNGHFRGHYLQAILRYKFNQHFAAHLWSEFIWPGNFYTTNERFSFLRAELMMTF